jgi:hypothetical protein
MYTAQVTFQFSTRQGEFPSQILPFRSESVLENNFFSFKHYSEKGANSTLIGVIVSVMANPTFLCIEVSKSAWSVKIIKYLANAIGKKDEPKSRFSTSIPVLMMAFDV